MSKNKNLPAPSLRQAGGANLGFENQMWVAADKLRGHMDASEYKDVVLGLIFLKYISDAFQSKYKQLEATKGTEYTDPEDRDEYAAANIFWVPKEAGEYRGVPGFCKSATTDEIREHGYVLTPGRYVGAAEIEDDGVPFEEKMANFQPRSTSSSPKLTGSTCPSKPRRRQGGFGLWGVMFY